MRNRSSLVGQWVKYLVVLLQWPRLLLWCGFDPWPGNFQSTGTEKKMNEEERNITEVTEKKKTLMKFYEQLYLQKSS